MTTNNRSADDVIVIVPRRRFVNKECSAGGYKEERHINLSELAEECIREEIIGQPEITGWNNGVRRFLSKIREAMK